MAMTVKEKAAVATARKGGLNVIIHNDDILKRIKSAAKSQGISMYAAARLTRHSINKIPARGKIKGR